MLKLRDGLSVGFRVGRAASNEALSKAPDDILGAGRGILKETARSRLPLSALACFEVRRCDWGTLNDELRLMVGAGSSPSDSVSPSSHSPGYCRLISMFEGCRDGLGVSSSPPNTVSVRARPVSSMNRRVRGLRISGMDFRDAPFDRLRGDMRRGTVDAAAGAEILESIESVLFFVKPLSVLLRYSPGLAFSTEPDEELVLLRECWLLDFRTISLSRMDSVCDS